MTSDDLIAQLAERQVKMQEQFEERMTRIEKVFDRADVRFTRLEQSMSNSWIRIINYWQATIAISKI